MRGGSDEFETATELRARREGSHREAAPARARLCVRPVRRVERVLSLGIHPTVFYRWQRQLFEKGAAVFERRKDPTVPLTRRIAKLEEKLSNKNEVIAELMEEQIKAKKEYGDA